MGSLPLSVPEGCWRERGASASIVLWKNSWGPSDGGGGTEGGERRIHFGDAQGGVLGQAVQPAWEPGDVEEGVSGRWRLNGSSCRGKHTELNFSAELLLGWVRGADAGASE